MEGAVLCHNGITSHMRPYRHDRRAAAAAGDGVDVPKGVLAAAQRYIHARAGAAGGRF
jgi:hypothetical protein